MDLFGGAGGLIEFRAGLLASRGFAVLALAFFAYEDLPRTMARLDLDYFEEATAVLLRHPKVSPAAPISAVQDRQGAGREDAWGIGVLGTGGAVGS